jgi:hypothetical protein
MADFAIQTAGFQSPTQAFIPPRRSVDVTESTSDSESIVTPASDPRALPVSPGSVRPGSDLTLERYEITGNRATAWMLAMLQVMVGALLLATFAYACVVMTGGVWQLITDLMDFDPNRLIQLHRGGF